MSGVPPKSRVGFVVIKLSVEGNAYFLMRVNDKWKDVNFVGGHEKERDSGNFEMTARRELWEEVPSIRGYKNIILEALTPVVDYGPIQSRSRGKGVQYDIQFFLLKITEPPNVLVDSLGFRTKNIWVPECHLLNQGRIRVSGLVKFLDSIYPGGLRTIPYSSATDLQGIRDRFATTSGEQFEFELKM